MKHASLILLMLLALLLAACPVEDAPDGTTSAAVKTTNGDAAPGTSPAGEPAAGGEELEAITGKPKQFILIYSGDTLSIPGTMQGYNPPEGGLCALSAAVTDYMALITDYNRQRVLNEGGDASLIRTDLKRGLLGEHPFMLLDYGGWERPNDYAGEHYVALYLDMYAAFGYSAIGTKLYEKLAPERWAAYRPFLPDGLTVLASAGTPLAGAIPTVPVITREVHGARWGVVSVPLPELNAEFDTKLAQYLDAAAGLLAQQNCEYSILMLPDGRTPVYTGLETDSRFTVVIGAARRKSVPEGYGQMPETGALLLPEVNPGGRSIGICHFYFREDSTAPDMFFFTTKPAYDDGTLPLPYRQQIEAARVEHDRAVQEIQAAGGV